MNRFASTLFLASILVFAACGEKDEEPPPVTPDTAPPTIVDVSPADGSTIGVSRAILVTFSEGIRDTSLSLGGTMAADSHQTDWAGNRTLTITPTTLWAEGASRQLTIDAADLSANAMTTVTLTFTISASVDATPPTATIIPANATTIATAQPIVVTFDESMGTASLNLGGTLASQSDGGMWSTALDANDRLTVSPTSAWTEGAHTLTINAEDVAGNPLATLSVSYTVDASTTVIDAIPPSGTASPAGVYLGSSESIVITYDEEMNETSLVATGTMATSASDAWDINSQILTLSPVTTWPETTGTLTVNATDLAGNPANSIVLTYTVDGTAPTATAAPVTSSFIAGDATITITFSEAIDAGSLVLGGSMASASDGGSWTDTETLVINPTSVWTTATGATLSVDADDPAGNSLTTLSLTYDVDGTAPTVLSMTPDPATAISTFIQFQIRFSETVDTNSLSLSGTLLDAAHTTSFAQTSVPDDLLIIQATSGWNIGAGQTLMLEISDAAGNLLTLSLIYDVGVVHVSVNDPNATDVGGGSRAAPFATLRAATTSAAAYEIRVAAGVYPVERMLTANVGGRQLWGGYATDWSTRDPDAYVSEIQLTGTGMNPTSPILVGSGGLVDGFTIRGGNVAGDSAVQLYAMGTGATVSNNILHGGSPVQTNHGILSGSMVGTIDNNEIYATATGITMTTSTSDSECLVGGNSIDLTEFGEQTGILVSGSTSCDIEANWIYLGGDSLTTGIAIGSSSFAGPNIRNNLIVSDSTTSGFGIDAMQGGPVIQNNTIAFAHRGLNIATGNPIVTNNIFLGLDNAGGYCIFEAVAAFPSAVTNNSFFDCGDYIYHEASGPTDYGFTCSGIISTSCSAGTPLTISSANTSTDPDLTVGLELQASSPLSVRQGGQTITEVTDDILGVARTAPYSMGAFELD